MANLLGVARAPDLICDLPRGRIGSATLEIEPPSFSEDGSVLHVVERLRRAAVPMAIVNDARGTLTGVVTSTDLLQTILGEKPGGEKD